MAEEPRAEPAGKPEAWQTTGAKASRRRLGLGIAGFVILLFVLPVVAKLLHWF